MQLSHCPQRQHTLSPSYPLLRQKLWADSELMKTLLALPVLSTAKEGEYVTAIVRRCHTVDCIFKAHLLGVPHPYSSANPAEPATLAELESVRARRHSSTAWSR